jgi:hypothetical protein
MCRTGAIISGSAALALIHPHQFLPNDIDFYVLPFGFAAVLEFIEDHGYKIEPYDRALCNYFHQNIVVIKLVHPISHKSINVMTGLDSHVVKLITRFHSTLLMNYLSWFGLVDLYPEWTLEKRSLVVTDTPASQECQAKYVDRGYTVHHNVAELMRPLQAHVCQADPYCPTSTRSLHDGHCLVEPFEPDGFDMNTFERNMTWSLPVLCSFNSPDGEGHSNKT